MPSSIKATKEEHMEKYKVTYVEVLQYFCSVVQTLKTLVWYMGNNTGIWELYKYRNFNFVYRWS